MTNVLPAAITFEAKKTVRHNTDKEYREEKLGYEGDIIVLRNEPLIEVYEKLFSKDVEKYNEKVRNHEIRGKEIPNYYEKIKENEGQKNSPGLSYELVIQVGDIHTTSRENDQFLEPAKEILESYLRSFEKENTQMYVYEAAIHMDEKGGAHMHLSFVPHSDLFKKGLEHQVSMNSALKQMGFEKSIEEREDGSKFIQNAFDKWITAERDRLSDISMEHGIEINRSQEEKRDIHRSVEDFKLQVSILEGYREHELERAEKAFEAGDSREELEAYKNAYSSLLAQQDIGLKTSALIQRYEELCREDREFRNGYYKGVQNFLEKKEDEIQKENVQKREHQRDRYDEMLIDRHLYTLEKDESLEDFEERVRDTFEILITENKDLSLDLDQALAEKEQMQRERDEFEFRLGCDGSLDNFARACDYARENDKKRFLQMQREWSGEYGTEERKEWSKEQ